MDSATEEKVIAMSSPKSLHDILNLPSGPAVAPAPPKEPAGTLAEAVLERDAVPSFEELTPLPRPGDAYKAHSLPAAGPVPTLHVLLGDASMRGFAYGNFDSIDLLPGEQPGSGPVLVVRFAGLSPCEVRITGRNLERLHSYLGFLRITWIRELPSMGDFVDKTAPLIRRIEVKPLAG